MNLQPFEYYLKDSGLKESTTREHVKNLSRFMHWAKENDLTGIEHLTYPELLNYIQYLKTKKLSTHTLNIRLNSICKYFEHLKEEGRAESNPARKLYIKGAVKKIVHNPLSYTELEKLYYDYEKYTEEKPIREAKQHLSKQKSIVVLGLMIWQAVHSGELKKIEKQHINLKQGMIYLPSTARSNSREIKLETAQILPLHKYLHRLGENQTYLIENNSHNLIARITEELKGLNQSVTSARHIRASVILHWLKMYNKREVQYMAGHKWISSTENYEVQELEGLTDLLQKHHPFN